MDEQGLTLYKLVVLYMLSLIDFPLKHSHISDFILDKMYLHPEIDTIEDMENLKNTASFTNYVNLQQVLDELSDAGHLETESTHNSKQYTISKAGLTLIHMFEQKIPTFIKEEIKTYVTERKYQLRNEVETYSTYYPGIHDEFTVVCTVKERGTTLLELKINVVSLDQAQHVCRNWDKKNSHIYAYLCKTLYGSETDSTMDT